MAFFRSCFSLLSVSVTTFAAVLFTQCPCARAELIITGPSPSEIQALGAWYEHHIPAQFKTRSSLSVRQLTDREMEAYLKSSGDVADSDQTPSSYANNEDNGDIDGVFEDTPARIALRVPASGTLDMFTFAHEYGHYVWFTLLSKEDRKRYEAIYKRQRGAHRLVTRYAAVNVEEGFAEAFSFYAVEPPILAHRDTASYQFFTQWATTPAAQADGA